MIITLCGSAKFESEFHRWNQALSLTGHVVLSLSVHPSLHEGNKDWYTPEEKRMLDAVHLEKISRSDAIVVLNVDGYIGDSTKNEVRWANLHKVRLFAVEPARMGGMAQPATDLLTNPEIKLPDVPRIIRDAAFTVGVDVFSDEEDLMKVFENTTEDFNLEQVQSYVKMNIEEFTEMLVGFNVSEKSIIEATMHQLSEHLRRSTRFCDPKTLDPVEGLDGIMDLMVVAINLGLSAGWPMRAAWKAVHRANMGKAGPDGKLIKDAMGKVQKPEGWKSPNEELKALIEQFRG